MVRKRHLAEEVPRPRKRRIGDWDGEEVDEDWDGDGDGDEDGDGEVFLCLAPPSSFPRLVPQVSSPPRWACPFWKYDPPRNVACSSYTLKRVQDVKQHLLRRHLPRRPYCPICLREFATSNQRDSHIIERKCRAADSPTHRGAAGSVTYISPDKEDKLRARMSGPDTENWYRIWDILFDDAEKPTSPHQGNIIEEVADVLRVFWGQHHQEIVSDVISGLGRSEVSVVQEHLPRLMSTALGRLIDRLAVTHKTSDSAPSSSGSNKDPTSDPDMSALFDFSLAPSLESLGSTSIGTAGASENTLHSWMFLDTATLYDLEPNKFAPQCHVDLPSPSLAVVSDSGPQPLSLPHSQSSV